MQKSPCIPDKNTLIGNVFACFIMAFCILWVLWFGLSASKMQRLVPDANIYLDVGRHINKGDGFTLSLNIRQGWVGNSRNALAYQQPFYSLILSLLKYDDKVVSSAVILNVAFTFLTIILLFIAWRNFLPSWQASLAILPFALSANLYDVYSTPLSEPFAMLVLAASLAVFLCSDKYRTLAGFLFGLSFLARAPNALGILGLLLVLVIEDRKNLKNFLAFFVALLLPILIFEVVGFLITGEWHPSYAKEARTFRLTRDYGGASYENAMPSLIFTGTITTKIFLMMVYHNVSSHLKYIISSIGWLTFFLSAIGALTAKWIEKRKEILATFMFALASAVLFPFVFYFGTFIEARYSLPSLAIMLPLGVLGIQSIAQRIRIGKKVEIGLISLFLVCISAIQGVKTYKLFENNRAQYLNADVQRIFFNQPIEWIKDQTKPDALVATNYYQVPFLFNRPMVTLPINRQLTQNNLRKFLQVHKPKTILVDILNSQQIEWKNPIYLKILEESGYKQVDSNERFVLYAFETMDKK